MTKSFLKKKYQKFNAHYGKNKILCKKKIPSLFNIYYEDLVLKHHMPHTVATKSLTLHLFPLVNSGVPKFKVEFKQNYSQIETQDEYNIPPIFPYGITFFVLSNTPITHSRFMTKILLRSDI